MLDQEHPMRYFFQTVSTFAFGLFVALGLSNFHGELTAPVDEGMSWVPNSTPIISTDGNAVDVDGIRFETVGPDNVVFIPPKQPGAVNLVKLGIRISNQTPSPVRMNWINSVYPALVGADGEPLKMLGGRDVFMVKNRQSTCPLVMPGKSVTLWLEDQLYWQNDSLKFGSATGYSSGWYFEGLKPGTYYVRLSYFNREPKNFCFDPADPKIKAISGLWTGSVATPLVKFRLKSERVL